MRILTQKDLTKRKYASFSERTVEEERIQDIISWIVEPKLIELYFDGDAKEYREKTNYHATNQTISNVYHALEGALTNKVILDLGCGSNSRDPRTSYDNFMMGGPGGERTFEPWLPRALHILGARPVGVDYGSLEGEVFEHYHANLLLEGALDFISDNSVDLAHSKLLFSSPQLEMMGGSEKLIKGRLLPQLERIVKPMGAYLSIE